MKRPYSRRTFRVTEIALTREFVELTGFEPVAPSLRKMRSNTCDQGKRQPLAGLWGGCGTSGVRHRETSSDETATPPPRQARRRRLIETHATPQNEGPQFPPPHG